MATLKKAAKKKPGPKPITAEAAAPISPSKHVSVTTTFGALISAANRLAKVADFVESVQKRESAERDDHEAQQTERVGDCDGGVCGGALCYISDQTG
jgi:hypothetical protein